MGGNNKKAEKEKPLDKMTVKELRDLVSAIKKLRGIQEDSSGKSDATVREIKKKMRELKIVQASAVSEENLRMARIYKKKIVRLKKLTRRAA